jgi:DNA-binding response OmpR family regulator
MQHSGDVCEYDDVILAVWGNPRDKDSLHELIYRVRRKIEPDPAEPALIKSVRGAGYLFAAKVTRA